jgi:AcrR family transcriptional regulator
VSVSPVRQSRAEASDRAPAPTGPAERLLATATKLFAAQGIRAVGVDQILREAAVAKASLYSTYGSKDALVIAYLADLDQRDRNRWTQAVADVTDPIDRALTFFDLAITNAPARGFRGCLYANAATEFPDTELAPVRAHRQWMHGILAAQFFQAGVDSSIDLAHQVQVIYDGALVGSKIERSAEPLRRARALALELIARSGRDDDSG